MEMELRFGHLFKKLTILHFLTNGPTNPCPANGIGRNDNIGRTHWCAPTNGTYGITNVPYGITNVPYGITNVPYGRGRTICRPK